MPSPVIVGGIGGSGTRLIAQMLRALGVDMGMEVNSTEDALAYVSLYDDLINDYLSANATLETVDASLCIALKRHCMAMERGQRWGWKNPRSIYLWPAFAALLPDACFIHVVRDGLSMATSRNQNQLMKHGQLVLGTAYDAFSMNARSLALWARVNFAASMLGDALKERYLLLRFEDALSNPQAVMDQIAVFMRMPPSAVAHLPIRETRLRELKLEDVPIEIADWIGQVMVGLGYDLC